MRVALRETQSAGESASPDAADSELVRQAKAGDLLAFEALATRHERRIYTVARRITANDHDAEDVTQQAFVSALEHLEGFREEASFSTWLLRIATHAALKISKRKGLPTVSLEQTPSRRKATILSRILSSSPTGGARQLVHRKRNGAAHRRRPQST